MEGVRIASNRLVFGDAGGVYGSGRIRARVNLEALETTVYCQVLGNDAIRVYLVFKTMSHSFVKLNHLTEPRDRWEA